MENGFLTVTIAKQPGVAYLVETAGSPNAASFSAATTTVLVDDAVTLKVRDNFAAGASPGGRYVRIRVTAAP
jgi:hypothetical protein